MHNLLRFILRNKKIHAYIKGKYKEAQSTTSLSTSISEVTPLHIRKGAFCERRLNLVIPALSVKHVFGGIATALAFFEKLGAGEKNMRIILTDEAEFSYEKNPAYKEWKILNMTDNDQAGHVIVAAGDRYGKTLAVAKGDIFIATAWWTAITVKSIIDQQNRTFDSSQRNKYIYLIQDFEPGFYPWSARYALAESTYHNKDQCIAVFNTSILKEFFNSEGYCFSSQFHFEPILHNGLRPYLPSVVNHVRERKILVYGRPGVDRNAFEIIVMALRLWISRTGGEGWQFYSAGEKHPAIDLGNGCYLASLGKLSLDQYAQQLLSSYAGISLMISPHPSYPPLEMAAFGMHVITNRYGAKNLSLMADNIISVQSASPEAVAKALDSILDSYNHGVVLQTPVTDSFKHYCSATDQFDEIVGLITAELKQEIAVSE